MSMEHQLIEEQQQNNVYEEKIEINLEERQLDDGLLLGKIKNIKAFNDVLKYTKLHKKQSGIFITFTTGTLTTNNEIMQFHDDRCFYNGVDMYYDATITKVNDMHMLEIWLDNDKMYRVFFILKKNMIYFPNDLKYRTIVKGNLSFAVKFYR